MLKNRSKTSMNYGTRFLSKKYPKSEPKRVQKPLKNELTIDMLAQGVYLGALLDILGALLGVSWVGLGLSWSSLGSQGSPGGSGGPPGSDF